MNPYAAKPWLAHYEPHVPATLDYPARLLPQVLKETARRYSDQPAIIFKGKTVSYGELDRAVDAFAGALQELGVAEGDRVAIHLPNCPQFPIAYYAALRVGAIVVPCNPTYTARELIHQLNDAEAKVIVTLSLMYPLVHQIRTETPLEKVVVAQIKSYFPTVLKLLFTLLRENKMGHRVSIAGHPNTYWFMELLENARPLAQPVTPAAEDTAVLM
ncbi:MAG: AMP-binding protein, partial [Candidatus Promineifilaceae bacterium]|nr:AMP-binding protein [Candidatus Promineifilaceae bacterium]